jgi:hypothetical protein
MKTLNPLFTRILPLALALCAGQVFAQGMPAVPSSGTALECLSRDCLIELVDAYFDALVAHDPARLPFAQNVYFVENIDHKPIGEGLWRSASAAPSAFRIYVPDPVSKEVGFLGMMEEEGKPLMIALRLKVVDGMIREVEHVLARNLRDTMLANLQTPRPGISTDLSLEERMNRRDLIGIAYSYYDALVLDDGDLAPMADDCERHENGMITARPKPATPQEGPPNFGMMGCTGQLDTGIMAYIDDLDNRRVEIADPVTGLVMGFSHFRHAMTNKTLPIYGVPGIEEREVNFVPFDLPAAHIFKVRDGWIHEIEAMGFAAPYNSPTGWE